MKIVFKNQAIRSLVKSVGYALSMGLLACQSNPGQVDRGRQAVADRGCPVCHQSADPARLSGQTQARPGTQAYGSNLTADVDTGLGGWPAIEIVRAIKFGTDDDGLPLCPPMPHFGSAYVGDAINIPDGDAMSDDEAYDIAAYLHSLPAVHREVPESTCPPIKPIPVDTNTDGGG